MTVKLPTIKNVDMYTAKMYPDLWTGGNPKGAIIHNDAGRMSATDYITWLKNARTPGTSKAELGFANYYIDRNSIVRVATTTIGGYAAANPYYNKNFLHYEVCQQLGATDEEWLANERAVFMQVAEDFHYYGLKPSKDTIALHHDVSRTGTSCPQRSMKTHGNSYPKVREYFIAQVAYYMSLGRTVKEMVAKLNNTNSKTTTTATSVQKGKELQKYEGNPKGENWKAMKVGDKVTIRKGAARWVNASFKQMEPMKKDYAGTTDTIEKVANVKIGYSNKAYYLKRLKVWVLEQDLVEPRQEIYTVQTGAYSNADNAKKQAEKLKKDGYDTFVTKK